MDSTNRNAEVPADPLNDEFVEALGEVEAALFQSEALHQTFLEQSPIGIAHLSAAGVVTFENHQLRVITGEDPDAAWIGRSVAEIEGLEARLTVLANQMLADGHPLNENELRFERSDGIRRYLHVHGTPIQHPEHGIVGGVLMVSDVTAEHERAEELRLLRRYDEAEPVLHYAAISQTSDREFLHSAARLLGETACADHAVVLFFDKAQGVYTEGERWSHQPGDDSLQALHVGAHLLPMMAGSRLAHTHTDQGASRLQCLLETLGAREVVALPFSDDEAQGGAILVVRTSEAEPWNETERTALGRLGVLVETLWAGMRTEARYQQVVASIEDCLFSFWFGADGERAYSFLSDQVESITGYRADDVLTGTCSWRGRIVHPEDRAAVASHDRALRMEQESRLVYRVQTPNGRVHWLRESATPHRDHADRLIVAGVLSDVTGARETEADLARTKQDAASATRAKSSFLSMMSHEIRTPLGAINGFAELLLEEIADLDDPPPVVVEFATTIREGASKVLRLVNDIFDLATLQSGRVDVQCNPVPLHPVIEGIAQRHKAALAERNISLHLDLHEAGPIVLGDAGRIGQVVDQLLSNAVKFTDEGQVLVSTAPEGDAVRIRVEDTGIGVPPEYVSSMFEPFSQGDNRLNRDYEGSGLGLALVRRIIEAMDGTITATSTQGEGTAFDVTLLRADG